MPPRREKLTNIPTFVDTSQCNIIQFPNKGYEHDKVDSVTKILTSPTASHTEVVAHARRLIASITSLDAEREKKPTSPPSNRVTPNRARDNEEPAPDESSHVSSPTLSCGTFSDDDFSTCSTEDLLDQVKSRLSLPNPTTFEADDLLSTSSSLNTRRQKQISGLRKKLHTSEMTKLELLNQCAELWTRVENVECNNARVKEYRQQNVKLREDTATCERDFMNEVSKLVHQMKEMDKKYTDTIVERDNRIAEMEMELKQLKQSNEVACEPASKI